MEKNYKVEGIGGFFFRSKDPVSLGKWYENYFEINSMNSNSLWRQEEGPTVFAPFDQATTYFGDSGQKFMLNFRVSNLEELLAYFKESGIKIEEKTNNDSIGKFAWVYDPEGNKIELWEPKDKYK